MNPLLVLLCEVTLVFSVALLGTLLASRARAALRHLILAAAFGVVLILPLAMLFSPPVSVEIAALPAREPDPIAIDPAALPAPSTVDVPPIPVEAISVASPLTTAPAMRISPTTWLFLAWSVVASVAVMPVIAGLWHLRRIRRSSHLWSEGAARVAQLMHPAASPHLAILLNVKLAAPITGGIVRPAIALPADAMTWSDTHLVNALLHELEHVRRRDWAVHLAARVVCALYWFHPLAWVAWRHLRLEAERACDDAVLAQEDAAVYAEQLLDLARRLSGKPVLPVLHMAGDSSLSSRIKSVLDNDRPRGRAGRMALISGAIAVLLAIGLLAPLRPTGPLRGNANQPQSQPAVTELTAAPANSPSTPAHPTEPSKPAFNYAERMGLVDLNGRCLSIFNSSIERGTKVTLVRPRSSDAAVVIEATVEESRTQKCRSSLDRNDNYQIEPTYYRIAASGGSTPESGVVFAVLDPIGPVALSNEEIAADVDGDGANESFSTCTSSESVHYMVWNGSAAQRRSRWNGNIYLGYDAEPTCTEADIAGIEALSGSTPAVATTAPPVQKAHVATATEVVSSILDLVQTAMSDEQTGKLDDITRPVTGLQHVQRRAQAVLRDNGSSPGTLATYYVEIINALAITANTAGTIAGRRPDLQLSADKFQQLAAALREKSVELATVVMPVSEIQPNVTLPVHRTALRALELAQTAQRERRFGPSWLPVQLSTLERAAMSVASDDGAISGATTMKANLLRSSLKIANRQANEIAGRPNVAADARRKAADLATSLSDMGEQLDDRTFQAGLTNDINYPL